jgi:hypothetical protein
MGEMASVTLIDRSFRVSLTSAYIVSSSGRWQQRSRVSVRVQLPARATCAGGRCFREAAHVPPIRVEVAAVRRFEPGRAHRRGARRFDE